MRKWLIKVCDYPEISPRKFYRLKITHIEQKNKSPVMEVTVQHLSPEQEGRSHQFVLPLPVRPMNLAAQFFLASGLQTNLGAEIEPQSVVGRTILVTFSRDETGEYHPTHFMSAKDELPNETEKP